MKFYVDEKGHRYQVDRETGTRTLINETTGTHPADRDGDSGTPENAAENEDE